MIVLDLIGSDRTELILVVIVHKLVVIVLN